MVFPLKRFMEKYYIQSDKSLYRLFGGQKFNVEYIDACINIHFSFFSLPFYNNEFSMPVISDENGFVSSSACIRVYNHLLNVCLCAVVSFLQ